MHTVCLCDSKSFARQLLKFLLLACQVLWIHIEGMRILLFWLTLTSLHAMEVLPHAGASYYTVKLHFRGSGDAFSFLQVQTNVRKDFRDEEPQNTGVEDLDFVIETLNTPEG